MTIYILILLFIFLTSLMKSRNLNKVDAIFFVFLVIISGLRYGIGTDYFNYINSFELINLGREKEFEPGFLLINKIVANTSFNGQAVILISSILTTYFFYKGIKFYTKNQYTYKPILYIVFLLFTYFNSFNGIRQVLAAAILFYASKYIVERKLVMYIIWILVALQFHYSSIFLFALYFIAQLNFKKITLLVTLLICAIVSNLGLVNLFLTNIYQNYIFLDIGGYLGDYLNSSYNERNVSYGIVFFINVFITIVFILFKEKIVKSEKDILIFNFFYLYVLLGVLSMGAPMLTRLTYLFSIYMALCIPKFIPIFDKSSRKIVEYLLTALYVLLYLYIVVGGYFNPGQIDYVPYKFTLNFFN